MGNTQIGDSASAVEQTQYDSYAKNILSNRYILAWIMRDTVSEFAELPIEQIATECINPEIIISEAAFLSEKIIGDNTESNIPGEGMVTFDIRFHAYAPQKKGRKKILFDVEAQKKFHPGYEIVTRGIFYGARMISTQAKTEFNFDNYNGIKKVYSIWICMNATDKVGNAISKFSITKSDLEAGIPNKLASYDKLTVIQITLGGETKASKKRIIRLLNIIFMERMPTHEKEKIMEEEFGVILNGKQREEFREMCNFSEGILERGMEQGIKQGIEQGDARRLTESVEKIMKNLRISLENACALLEITIEQYGEASKYLK